MAKIMKNFRLNESVIDKIREIGDSEFDGNLTAALEDMIKHSHLVRSIPDYERDRLRVSARRGHFGEVYEKYERKMIDFFLI